jgi:hypothetical protein
MAMSITKIPNPARIDTNVVLPKKSNSPKGRNSSKTYINPPKISSTKAGGIRKFIFRFFCAEITTFDPSLNLFAL